VTQLLQHQAQVGLKSGTDLVTGVAVVAVSLVAKETATRTCFINLSRLRLP